MSPDRLDAIEARLAALENGSRLAAVEERPYCSRCGNGRYVMPVCSKCEHEEAQTQQIKAQEAESLCNALMSAGLAECERLRVVSMDYWNKAVELRAELDDATHRLDMAGDAIEMLEMDRDGFAKRIEAAVQQERTRCAEVVDAWGTDPNVPREWRDAFKSLCGCIAKDIRTPIKERLKFWPGRESTTPRKATKEKASDPLAAMRADEEAHRARFKAELEEDSCPSMLRAPWEAAKAAAVRCSTCEGRGTETWSDPATGEKVVRYGSCPDCNGTGRAGAVGERGQQTSEAAAFNRTTLDAPRQPSSPADAPKEPGTSSPAEGDVVRVERSVIGTVSGDWMVWIDDEPAGYHHVKEHAEASADAFRRILTTVAADARRALLREAWEPLAAARSYVADAEDRLVGAHGEPEWDDMTDEGRAIQDLRVAGIHLERARKALAAEPGRST